MRKITQDVVAAFLAAKEFTRTNSDVVIRPTFYQDGTNKTIVVLRLHANEIARYNAEDGIDSLEITTAGWSSNTTKERLNGLPNVHVHHKRKQLYLNNTVWDGDWVKV